MVRDPGDIIDRWSISKLKAERIGSAENKREHEAFSNALGELISKNKNIEWDKITKLMYSINDFIWQFESGLKSGKEKLENPHYILDELNERALANIGAATIIIRNFNHLRVEFKNLINGMLKTGFQDKKENHLSE